MNNNNIKVLPKIGFAAAVKNALANLTKFSGRARRSEYWWFVLAITIVSIVCSQILASFPTLNLGVSFILGLLTYSVLARRLNDTGKNGLVLVVIKFILDLLLNVYLLQSGFYDKVCAVNPDAKAIIDIVSNPFFLGLTAIGMIYSLVLFVFCVLDSNIDANKYGASPKYVVENQAWTKCE